MKDYYKDERRDIKKLPMKWVGPDQFEEYNGPAGYNKQEGLEMHEGDGRWIYIETDPLISSDFPALKSAANAALEKTLMIGQEAENKVPYETVIATHNDKTGLLLSNPQRLRDLGIDTDMIAKEHEAPRPISTEKSRGWQDMLAEQKAQNAEKPDFRSV